MNTIISFIIIFGALVFFHEMGHFIFAKRAGILVREFAIGFGPKIFSYTKDETTYTIRLLPIGGFVRMAGEDPEMAEIKPGHRIALLLNENEIVEKIILNGRIVFPMQSRWKLKRLIWNTTLYDRGYEDGEDEVLKTFRISRKALIVENQTETLIAPWDRQFASKKLGSRAMTIFAGPMMNFVLAIVVFTIIGFIQGVPVQEPMLGMISQDSAAQEAGLKQGDAVISIDGAEIASFADITEVVKSTLKSNWFLLLNGRVKQSIFRSLQEESSLRTRNLVKSGFKCSLINH